MNREELRNEIMCIVIKNPSGDLCMDAIADFIIKDRQRILKPIIEHKKTWHDGEWGCVKFKDAMNEALGLAGLMEIRTE